LDSHQTVTIRQWYNKDSGFMLGTLFVVATPIGNLEDITARALRILREATLIAAEDTRRTSHLLARYAITTPTTSLHAHNEGRKTASLIERLQHGDTIALVSDAGTPTVSDPGGHLIRSAIAAGIRVEPIPGASAALTALSASGLPTESFVFLGFPPTRAAARSKWIDEVKTAGRTVVFFEAPHRIQHTLRELLRHVGDVAVAVGRELTKAHEELVRGHISDVVTRLDPPRGEFTVVLSIGQTTDNGAPAGPAPHELGSEFGVMTNIGGLTRRAAISKLARKYGLSAREVYSAIETAKKSGE
jgi:16S rRNA (cytidine1402-2'-O)-methyltransferase